MTGENIPMQEMVEQCFGNQTNAFIRVPGKGIICSF